MVSVAFDVERLREVCERYGVVRLEVFGSVARGVTHLESDIDLLLVIPFTPAFAATPAEAFVRTVLHGCLGVRALVIGHDYAFGRGVRLGWAIEDLAEELSVVLGRPVDLVSRRALNARLRDQVLQEAQPFYAAA